jgi:hypothetical protein
MFPRNIAFGHAADHGNGCRRQGFLLVFPCRKRHGRIGKPGQFLNEEFCYRIAVGPTAGQIGEFATLPAGSWLFGSLLRWHRRRSGFCPIFNRQETNHAT